MTTQKKQSETMQFQTEIKQLLDILVHSLYSQQEIFLRELISNASDALHRIKFEMLTNRDVLNPDAELAIRIKTDSEKGVLIISDTGIGMTHDELVENLGVIAHSGAAQFIAALQAQQQSPAAIDQIGQFGVGFYSVFMVADEVTVTSRSYRPDESAWVWRSAGDDSYTLTPADREERGTTIEIKLKEDAKKYTESWQIRSIIHKYSDFVTFPIYLNDENEPVNRQQAIWRQSPSQIEDEAANEFYKQLTYNFDEPLTRIVVQADAPVQLYALMYIPARLDRTLLGLKQDYGLRLYSRQIRIEDHNKELLPPYLRFIEGVVDSEDIPLNVSREMVQSTRVISKIKSVLTRKVLNALADMARQDQEKYATFWREFGIFIKEGISTAPGDHAKLTPLLRFYSSTSEDELVSLPDYVSRMQPEQKSIYYLAGENLAAIKRSPHLEHFRQKEIEVLYFDQPMDVFLPQSLGKYEDFEFANVDRADVKAAGEEDVDQPEPDEAFARLLARAKSLLGDKVIDVRPSQVLVSHPARLAAPEDGLDSGIERVRRLMEEDYSIPPMVLELNPEHDIIVNLMQRLAGVEEDAIADLAIEQLYEDALLLDGFHPDPARMVERIQQLIAAATRA